MKTTEIDLKFDATTGTFRLDAELGSVVVNGTTIRVFFHGDDEHVAERVLPAGATEEQVLRVVAEYESTLR